METIETKGNLQKDGLILFTYSLSCPDLQEDPSITENYQHLCQALLEELKTKGEEMGKACLEKHLQEGKKRSRFCAPCYCLSNQTETTSDGIKVILTATLLQGKELLFSKTETHFWDTTYPEPVLKRKK